MLEIQEKRRQEELRIRKMKEVAKIRKWNIFLGDDKYNFHIVTQEGIRFGREEWHNAVGDYEGWFVVLKNEEKKFGNFMDMVTLFVGDYNRYRNNVMFL